MEASTSDADLNKKKEWRKKMKELQKEKKRLQKEEEHKKNLMSKDSKVVMIDKKTFETFSRKTKGAQNSETPSGPINLNDFPELKVAPEKKEIEKGSERRRTSKLTRSSWSRLPITETLRNDHSADTFPSLESTFNRERRKAGTTREIPVQSSSSNDLPQPATTEPIIENEKPKPSEKEQPGKKSKKKKHKDPVVLNLNEILIAKSAKKDKKPQVPGSKYRKRSERTLLSGNILDSANPKRSKGKHREKKKKRLSNLKYAIIKDRIIKAKVREKAVEWAFKHSDVDFNEEIDFKAEVENYLERFKALRAAKRQKNRVSSDTTEEKLNFPVKSVAVNGVTKEKLDFPVKNAQSSDISRPAVAFPQSRDAKKEKPLTCSSENFLSNDTSSNISNDTIKLRQFSSKFRDYCENALTPSLDAAVKELIKEIVYLQDRMFARDPIKARAKKRHVIGLREAKKYLSLKKVKMLIIAPDLEKSESKDSISDLINELKELSAAQNVPCVFALDRRKLGYSSKKKVPVSVFAILNYEGTEVKFASLLEAFAEAKELFGRSPLAPKKEETKVEEEQAPIVDDVTRQLASTFISVLSEKKNESDTHVDDDQEIVNPFLRALTHCDRN